MGQMGGPPAPLYLCVDAKPIFLERDEAGGEMYRLSWEEHNTSVARGIDNAFRVSVLICGNFKVTLNPISEN